MLTYTHETIAGAVKDLHKMIPVQWHHTGDPTIPCEPRWDIYTALEAKNALALFIARRDGDAVGYCTAMLHPHMNSRRVIVGTIPTWFAESGPSSGLVTRSLLRQASDWLVGKGAKQVFVETEYAHSAGRMLEQMGFVASKIGYRMAVHDDASGSRQ